MNILIVGNVIKDVYLNLDSRTEHFETDKNNIDWLDLEFKASEHHFFNRESSFGGSAISLEVFKKLGLDASISDPTLHYTDNGFTSDSPDYTYRYILVADSGVSYFVPANYQTTTFVAPADTYDYLYLDRSAELDDFNAKKILAYLDISKDTKLILYIRNLDNPALNQLIPYADLVFREENKSNPESFTAPRSIEISPDKLIHLSEHQISYQNLSENITIDRVDKLTHLSAYSILSATILGGFMLGHSVEDSLKMARANIENTKLNSTLSLEELQEATADLAPAENLELIAKSLVFHPKGILAADESGGSIHKKFAQLGIPDTYDNRRDYRNIFFTTPNLEQFVNGVILFDETARQQSDNGQNFVDFLTARRIIPGIKVDQGLNPLNTTSLETYTKGLDGLANRLKEYHELGLRFAKWRAAFEIRLSLRGNILTPTPEAIAKNCDILAEYAKECQSASIVPIVEPEVVYDGYYSIDNSASITSQILDRLFVALKDRGVNLKACILKVNMVIAGKNYPVKSTPDEVGEQTAKVLKEHVPTELAGVVFLSGGQTVEQATDNLASITKHGPFPWPVTFSFARALQDPALYTWAGDNHNAEKARQAFLDRLIANTKALES